MKAIIYYSLSGRTKEEVENRFEGDFFRVKGRIKIPKNYYLQLAYLGMFASLNTKLKYQPLDIDFDKYDEIVLASPTWAWTIVPFMKKFLKDHPFTKKNVTLLITHEGGPGKVMNRFKRFVPKGNTIIDTFSIQRGSAYKEATIYKKKKQHSFECCFCTIDW
jgi:flavodoxin